jgi:predicted DNA-binding transcriptional regulator YafY
VNRVDRLFNILLILQRRKRVRAADLAREFEVSPRTIYRDMDALGEMGVPVIATPSEGFALIEGFYLPPLSFTSEEARAVFLGVRMLAAQATVDLSKHANQAMEKIAHILPEASRRDVQQVLDTIRFFLPPDEFDLNDPYVVTLQRAITERRLVLIRYNSREDEITERIIEPQLLNFSGEAWYVDAYCRLRRDRRAFRLDRIERLDVLHEHFTPREIPPSADATPFLNVRVRVAGEAVRWIRERQHYGYSHDEAKLKNSDRIMVYQVHRTDELKSWLMGWGTQVEILTPESLRVEIREEARKLAALLT